MSSEFLCGTDDGQVLRDKIGVTGKHSKLGKRCFAEIINDNDIAGLGTH